MSLFRVPHGWSCARCGAEGYPQKYAKDHMIEEHGWVEGEGFVDDG